MSGPVIEYIFKVDPLHTSSGRKVARELKEVQETKVPDVWPGQTIDMLTLTSLRVTRSFADTSLAWTIRGLPAIANIRPGKSISRSMLGVISKGSRAVTEKIRL